MSALLRISRRNKTVNLLLNHNLQKWLFFDLRNLCIWKLCLSWNFPRARWYRHNVAKFVSKRTYLQANFYLLSRPFSIIMQNSQVNLFISIHMLGSSILASFCSLRFCNTSVVASIKQPSHRMYAWKLGTWIKLYVSW